MAKMRRDFTYAPGATEIATPLLEVLAKRSGVCQDFAHLMIACLRSVGLSARYVSGYLRTHGHGGTGAPSGAALSGADAEMRRRRSAAAEPARTAESRGAGLRRGCAARMPRTPGWRCLPRRSAGSASIRPTTCA